MFTKFITKLVLASAVLVGLIGFAGSAQAGNNLVANGDTSCFDQSIFFNNDVPRRGTIKTSKNKVERTCDTINGVSVYGVVHAKGKTHPVNACNRAGTRCWLDESIRSGGRADNDNRWETDDGLTAEQSHITVMIPIPRNRPTNRGWCGPSELHEMVGIQCHRGNGKHSHGQFTHTHP